MEKKNAPFWVDGTEYPWERGRAEKIQNGKAEN